MDRRIKILIVDAHPGIRSALRLAFALAPDFRMIAEAQTAYEALDLIPRLRPDVVLMDIHMRPVNGIELTRLLHESYPDLTLIGFAGAQSERIVRRMREAGAAGLITKGTPVAELCKTILSLHRHHRERVH